MKIEVMKWIVCAVVLITLCFMCYLLGRSHAEIKVVKQKGDEIIKEVEVVKYVEKQKSEIWSKPNAGHSELIELFMQDQL